MDVGLTLRASTVSELSFRFDGDDSEAQVCISNPGNGFMWLSADDARKLRDWLNENVVG